MEFLVVYTCTIKEEENDGVLVIRKIKVLNVMSKKLYTQDLFLFNVFPLLYLLG